MGTRLEKNFLESREKCIQILLLPFTELELYGKSINFEKKYNRDNHVYYY